VIGRTETVFWVKCRKTTRSRSHESRKGVGKSAFG
jgi:hypothetical protein